MPTMNTYRFVLPQMHMQIWRRQATDAEALEVAGEMARTYNWRIIVHREKGDVEAGTVGTVEPSGTASA